MSGESKYVTKCVMCVTLCALNYCEFKKITYVHGRFKPNRFKISKPQARRGVGGGGGHYISSYFVKLMFNASSVHGEGCVF